MRAFFSLILVWLVASCAARPQQLDARDDVRHFSWTLGIYHIIGAQTLKPSRELAPSMNLPTLCRMALRTMDQALAAGVIQSDSSPWQFYAVPRGARVITYVKNLRITLSWTPTAQDEPWSWSDSVDALQELFLALGQQQQQLALSQPGNATATALARNPSPRWASNFVFAPNDGPDFKASMAISMERVRRLEQVDIPCRGLGEQLATIKVLFMTRDGLPAQDVLNGIRRGLADARLQNIMTRRRRVFQGKVMVSNGIHGPAQSAADLRLAMILVWAAVKAHVEEQRNGQWTGLSLTCQLGQGVVMAATISLANFGEPNQWRRLNDTSSTTSSSFESEEEE